jgi:hypothetical protein
VARRSNRDRVEAGAQVGGVRFDPEASSELEEAAGWYEARESGLGNELLDEVARLLPALIRRPDSFPRLLGPATELGIRRALLPRFPFALVFIQVHEEIRVLAFAHAKRRPDYWLHRVEAKG